MVDMYRDTSAGMLNITSETDVFLGYHLNDCGVVFQYRHDWIVTVVLYSSMPRLYRVTAGDSNGAGARRAQCSVQK